MPFADHFSSLASGYAGFRPTYPPELFAWLAEIAPARELAWDCACGNGQASHGLADRFRHVIATDASAAQIKEAKPHPHVEYRVALAQDSGLPAHCADLVTVAQAAHWFASDAFYAEVRRVARPGGVLALWSYEFMGIEDEAVRQSIKEFCRELVPYWPPERAHVKAHYRTLPFPFADEIASPEFPLRASWNLDRLLGYFRSWSATKAFVKAKGFDPVAPLRARLTSAWGAPDSAREFTMPIFMRVARI
jgi:SAM-dependent methyltransferase